MSIIKLDYELLVIIFWMFYGIWILNEEWVSKVDISKVAHTFGMNPLWFMLIRLWKLWGERLCLPMLAYNSEPQLFN
jgi:hypothetical protein